MAAVLFGERFGNPSGKSHSFAAEAHRGGGGSPRASGPAGGDRRPPAPPRPTTWRCGAARGAAAKGSQTSALQHRPSFEPCRGLEREGSRSRGWRSALTASWIPGGPKSVPSRYDSRLADGGEQRDRDRAAHRGGRCALPAERGIVHRRRAGGGPDADLRGGVPRGPHEPLRHTYVEGCRCPLRIDAAAGRRFGLRPILEGGGAGARPSRSGTRTSRGSWASAKRRDARWRSRRGGGAHWRAAPRAWRCAIRSKGWRSNGRLEPRLPGNLNVSIEGIEVETLPLARRHSTLLGGGVRRGGRSHFACVLSPSMTRGSTPRSGSASADTISRGRSTRRRDG